MSVTVMLCYARSGGTLLNRALLGLKNTVVLSEVNPLNEDSVRALEKPITTLRGQAGRWYGIDLESQGFTRQVLEVNRWCEKRRKSLIIRDWTFIDFTPHKLNGFAPPYISSTIAALRGHLDLRVFALIRDGIDVYLSRGGAVEAFFDSYHRYVSYLRDNGIQLFKYEDLCRFPRETLGEILHFAELPAPKTIHLHPATEGLTGDVEISRGNVAQGIRQLKRRYAHRGLRKRVNDCERMVGANKMAGYPTTYEAVETESLISEIRFRVKRRVGGLFRTEDGGHWSDPRPTGRERRNG